MLLNMLTSVCLSTIAKPGFVDARHVSLPLAMTYLMPVPEGQKVIVECRIVTAWRAW